MKVIDVAVFRKHCLFHIHELTPEGLIITKRGKPVAKLIPYQPQPGQLIGSLRNKIRIHGPILSTGAWPGFDDSP